MAFVYSRVFQRQFMAVFMAETVTPPPKVCSHSLGFLREAEQGETVGWINHIYICGQPENQQSSSIETITVGHLRSCFEVKK